MRNNLTFNHLPPTLFSLRPSPIYEETHLFPQPGSKLLARSSLDLALGFVRGNAEGYSLAGVVAGFVERLLLSLFISLARAASSTARAPAERDSPAQ